MRKLVLLPVLTLALACSDTTFVEPPIEPEPGPSVVAAKVMTMAYNFEADIFWFCDAELGCGTDRVTPSGVAHGKGLEIGLISTGELVGELWVTADYNINMVNGTGIANASAVLNLTSPGIGSFECKGHAEFEGYSPPDFAYVEHLRYSGCKGSGDFEGKKMKFWADNAGPGSTHYVGVAEIR